MMEDFEILRRSVLNFLLTSAAVTAAALLVLLDVRFLETGAAEISLTEFCQELLLFGVVGINLFLARLHRAESGAYLLIAGFFACMLFREFDYLFDELEGVSWFPFSLGVTVLGLAQALPRLKGTLSGLAGYCRCSGFPQVMIGLTILLCFSRIFGMGLLWENLLQDNYLRTAKNMAEEGLELLGYVLILLGHIYMLLDARLKKRKTA